MKKLSLALLTAATIALPQLVTAEDIEIYTGSDSFRQGAAPKVLIIFDNSGSMGAVETTTSSYDPSQSYSGSGSATAFSDAAIYFNRGTIDFGVGDYPEGHFDSRRFNEFLLGCETALEKLETVGFYTGYLMEYQVQGSSGSWQPFPGEMGLDKGNPVDCLDDILLEKGGNGKYKSGSSTIKIADGLYPYNNPTGKPKQDLTNAAYTDDISVASEKAVSLFTDNQSPVTLYKANFLRYQNSPVDEVGETTDKTRLEIAKESISNILSATPLFEYGMMVFNVNYPEDGLGDGGRIISKIQPMTDSSRTDLLGTIQNIEAETNTPLCETLFEAKRYLAGEAVEYGVKDYAPQDIKGYTANTPPRDLSAESGGSANVAGTYISPYQCEDYIHILLITDGEPSVDNHADSDILSLPITAKDYEVPAPIKMDEGRFSYLNVLAKWMQHNDINPNKEGNQHATLHTIGFGKDAIDNAGELLREAARVGGGEYFAAENPADLTETIFNSLYNILKVNSTFTSPSVASNNFDRTRSLDNVYYAMFLPGDGPRWRGNLKKLKLVGNTLVDKSGSPALDASGSISDDAQTFWSKAGAVPDGNDVRQGGVAAMLQNKTNRKVQINNGLSLIDIDANNIASLSEAFSGLCGPQPCQADAKLFDKYIGYALGQDVGDDDDDDNFTEMRADVFGDPLHSKPVVVSYSASDTRIIVGTNAGFLHMFKDLGDDSIDESWAFIPAELFKNIPILEANKNDSPKVYGVDGSPVVHFNDANGDGIVDGGDKVWLFFGLRRGGSSYYAVDITAPDSPKLMWHINDQTAGFSELGQSWSKPLISYIKPYGEKPVLVFSAGYSTNKDIAGIATEDPNGRGIFIVDAQTGSLVWSLTPDTQYKGKHSVAGGVAVMDSDLDGYTDRIYFADTGGSVWRVDAVGETSDWTHYELAKLSDGTTAGDRRFFYEPVVARTFTKVVEETDIEVDGNTETIVTRTTVPFDAVVIGSGTRPSPLGTTTEDKFFMLKDTRVVSAATTVDTTPSTITITDLVAIESTEPKSAEEIDQFDKAMTGKSGWYYSLTGTEKSLSPASILAGVAYFTSYTPPPPFEVKEEFSCVPETGGGLLYAFNLHYGTRVYNRLNFDVGKSIPDNPELFLGENEEQKSQLLFLNVNDSDVGEDNDGTIELRDKDGKALGLKTSRTYIYMGENQ